MTVFLTAAQVAERYGIDKSTLWHWRRNPEVNFPKPLKVGSTTIRWPLSALEGWEAERMEAS